jgi:two-component system response regulator PilR (NtrC family)
VPDLAPAPAEAPSGAKAGEAASAEALGAKAGEGHGFEVDQGVPSDLEAYLGVVEREAILAALARTGHNRTAAAQLLGISFRQMRYRMRRLGLK